MRSHTRLNSVHLAIYLLFNEGYSATEGDTVIRQELCMEAMRLMRSILDIPEICTADSYCIDGPDVFSYQWIFHTRRHGGRCNRSLEQQNRSLRDRDLVMLGAQYFNRTQGIVKPTRFVLEAAIASVHCAATTFEAINWQSIIGLYRQLRALQDSPVVDLSLAVALFYGQGPEAARHALAESPHAQWFSNSAYYYALLGKIEQTVGHATAAREYYTKALSLTRAQG